MRLLDGSTIDVQETLAKMADDKFYYVDMGTDKVLSYSSAKHLLKSPKWFEYKRRNPDPESQALRDGRLVHAAILEPEKYSNFNFVDVSSKNTKKWKLAVQETGKANTYTMKEKYMNARIVDAFLQNNECTAFLKNAEVEVAGLWETGGVPFRGKADILGADYVADVKTTNDGVAEIELKNGTSKNQFEFTMDKYDYDMQAYLYTKMFNVPKFVWLVVDKTTTDIGVFEASEETIERGRAKVEAAVMLYKAFFVDNLIDLSQYHVKKTI